ncbi:UNVERIFIED_ORG: quercetin dioxygenase-like cupin family protein [Rhizobium esperanzae]|nr:hypothetical protein RHECNPAF_3040016 [Rhizobium etli CNPAF512]
MRLNDDFTKPTVVHAAKLDWVASPARGVDRRMLYRVGEEVARATSIVRYAAGSVFPSHTHMGGEEILVLDGIFQDEHGRFPAGSYFRNPPGTSHAPASADGCTIFVKLWQFRAGDEAQIVRRPGEGEPGVQNDAVTATILFDDGHEQVYLQRWGRSASTKLSNHRGLELLVLEGELSVGTERLRSQSWMRLPEGENLLASAGPEGAYAWIKDAPLQHADVLKLPS